MWSRARQWSEQQRVIAALMAVVAAWCWLFGPTLRWLQQTLVRPEERLNLLLILTLAGVAAFRGAGASLQLAPLRDALTGPVPLAIGAALVHLLQMRWWEVDILSASLFVLGVFGLAGLMLPREQWRAALPGALLFVVALPFGDHLDRFVGFPARTATAALVHHLLSAIGVPSLSAESVLVLENGVANVDLPCSGVRSLWTGALFYLGATWLERKRLRPMWLLLGLGYAVALLAANFVRVALLVLIGFVLQRPDLAHVCHVPLGVIGFAGSSALAWVLLRKLPERAAAPVAKNSQGAPWLPVILASLFALAALARVSRPIPAALPAPTFAFQQEVRTTPLVLSPAERDLFMRHGSGTAQKWQFTWNGVSGSMLLVYSPSWRAHHPPEQCLASSGLHIDLSMPVEEAPGFTTQVLQLNSGRRAAHYWFQSSDRTTPSLLSRIWGEWDRSESQWVMVSIVFDQAPAPAEAAAFDLLVRAAVARGLRGQS